MIRIIEKIEVKSLDLEGKPVVELPMVPATGKVEVSDAADSAGILRTVTISATLTETVRALAGRVIVTLYFCDGSVQTWGSAELPLIFDVKIGDRVTISVKYKTAPGLVNG